MAAIVDTTLESYSSSVGSIEDQHRTPRERLIYQRIFYMEQAILRLL